MIEPRFATISELAQGLRRKRFSSVELTEATLALLTSHGPRYNAIAALMGDRAMAEARKADRALARGPARTPLHGVPYGAKDLLAAVGAPTTWGAPPYRDQVFDHDATVVAKLGRSGAVLAAKLAMVELAGGGGYRYANASLQGPGKNPWDTGRWSGGSSSGSGSAVCAGLVSYALGSETSGSIGTPAAFCGVTGIRPTYGLVSRHGAMALSWTLDKIGPMARTAEDCAIVLASISGGDASDPTARGKRFAALLPRAAAAALRKVRVGSADEDLGHATPQARRALERGLAELRRVVPRFDRAVLPADLPYGPMVGTVFGAEGATIFAELIASGRVDLLIDKRQAAGLKEGMEIRARDYLQAMRLRTVLGARFRELFTQVDVLVAPARTSTAPAIDAALDTRPPGAGSLAAIPAAGAPAPGNTGLIPAGNLAGLPAIFFPCGFGTDGLPVGLQLVGPPFSEPLLVAIVAAYQRETGHHLKRPPR
ncbi:MAG TPA: amidase [Candidatus Limnocylindria bacterium]|nr:amidase [Candidatus Limnocylindria bacterium]